MLINLILLEELKVSFFLLYASTHWWHNLFLWLHQMCVLYVRSYLISLAELTGWGTQVECLSLLLHFWQTTQNMHYGGGLDMLIHFYFFDVFTKVLITENLLSLTKRRLLIQKGRAYILPTYIFSSIKFLSYDEIFVLISSGWVLSCINLRKSLIALLNLSWVPL